MRLKKLMSLVLACAMALSLITVASAQDTRVYFAEDFSGYADAEGDNGLAAYLASTDTSTTVFNNQGAGYTAATAPAAIAAAAAAGKGMTFKPAGGNSGDFRVSNSKFTTNSFGSKMLTYDYGKIKPTGNETVLPAGGMYFVPYTSWDFVEHKDETYVISYEIQADPSIHGGKRSYDDRKTAPIASNSLQHIMTTSWSGTAGHNMKRGAQFVSTLGIEQVTETTTDPETGEPVETTKNVYTPASKVSYQFITHSFNNGGGTVNATFNAGQAYRVAYGTKFAYNADGSGKKVTRNSKEYYEPIRVFAIDGAPLNGDAQYLNYFKQYQGNSSWEMSHDGLTAITGFSLGSTYQTGFGYANIKAYTIKNGSFKAIIENNTNVPLTQKTIRVKFANPVAPATWTNAVEVKKGGVVMSADEYVVGALQHGKLVEDGEAYSYVDVTFESLEEGTTYTIDFADTIANEIATTLGEANSVATFSTKAPDVKLMPLSIVGAESLVADGSLQAVKAQLINNTSAPKSVALIYAVYAGDKLADIVYINDSVEDTTDYEVGLKLASAGTVKAFAWDGMTSLKPYTGAQQLTVAAAQ